MPLLENKDDGTKVSERTTKPPPNFKIALMAGSGILIVACIIMALLLSLNREASNSLKPLCSYTASIHTPSREPVNVEPLRPGIFWAGNPFYSLALRAKAQPRLFFGGGILLCAIIAISVTMVVILSKSSAPIVVQDAVDEEQKDLNHLSLEDQQSIAQKNISQWIGGGVGAVLAILIIIFVIYKLQSRRNPQEIQSNLEEEGNSSPDADKIHELERKIRLGLPIIRIMVAKTEEEENSSLVADKIPDPDSKSLWNCL
jgi:hypothetical protein